MTDIRIAPANTAAGFDSDEDYSEWLRLDGHRQLNLLITSQVRDGQSQMLDSVSEVLQTESTGAGRRRGWRLNCTSAGQQHALCAACLGRCCVRLLQRVCIHVLAPSRSGEGSVEPVLVADPNLSTGTGTQGGRS